MNFKTMTISDVEIVNAILSKTEFNGCDYQYSYMLAWLSREPSCISIAQENDAVFIMFKCIHLSHYAGELLFLPPLTTLDNFSDGVKNLKAYCESKGEKLKIVQASKEQVAMLDSSEYHLEKFEDADEYLYTPSDLINLQGKKYHAKRNHISKFLRNYPNYEFRPYTTKDYEGILKLFDMWTENKEGSIEDIHSFTREQYGIRTMLKNIEPLSLFADVLEVDNQIIGFSLGEITANGLGIVHFEKANINYEGSFAMLNNLFAKKHFENARLINRQEDMGIEGLRKAKLSYYPVDMCEKWCIKSM